MTDRDELLERLRSAVAHNRVEEYVRVRSPGATRVAVTVAKSRDLVRPHHYEVILDRSFPAPAGFIHETARFEMNPADFATGEDARRHLMLKTRKAVEAFWPVGLYEQDR